MSINDNRLPPRFWSKVKVDDNGCWRWLASITRKGYANFGWKPTKRIKLAHRVAYEALVAPVRSDLVLDHLCRVRDCVNPAHMEPVTAAENTRRGDRVAMTRHQREKTHCPKGHPYAGDNVYLEERGPRSPYGPARRCVACRREQRASSNVTKQFSVTG